ncbi:transposase [bacterium SCSIO 12741]|nr:transposase [bacterium SCSIO 12741]
MSEKYKFRNPDGIYFTTSTVVGWIDLFTRENYRNLILDSLQYCQKEKGLIIHAWVIMSNHIHLMVSNDGRQELGAVMRDFKRHTSVQIIKEIKAIQESRREWILAEFKKAGDRIKRNNGYKVWRDGNHPVELWSNEMIDQRLNYIHLNPVKAGLVADPIHYLHSSAKDYAGEKGELQLLLID